METLLEKRRPCDARRGAESLFCDEHTCRFCRAAGLTLERRVVDRPPRNVCSRHPLCVEVSPKGVQCDERTCDASLDYCELHAQRERRGASLVEQLEMQCCSGFVFKKNRQCRTTGRAPLGSKFFCPPHIDQRPDSSSSSSSSSSDDDDDDETDDEASLAADLEWRRPEPEALHDEGASPDDFVVVVADLQVEHVVEPPQAVPVVEPPPPPPPDSAAPEIAPRPPSPPSLPGPADGDDRSEHSDEGGAERTAFVDPDECSVFSEDESCSSLDEQMKHLREIDGDDFGSGSDSDEEECGEAVSDDEACCDVLGSGDPSEWSWALPAEARRRLAAELLREACATLTRLGQLADGHVARARRERSEAAARSFKTARLIGATVVGATRRLSALRASEPFAMIVEEACEAPAPPRDT